MAELSRGYVFTERQLSIYGIYELQTLEDLLRRKEQNGSATIVVEVCKRIRHKIAWDPADRDVDDRRFLEDFYAALRAHLEKKMLLGKRRERKGSS